MLYLLWSGYIILLPPEVVLLAHQTTREYENWCMADEPLTLDLYNDSLKNELLHFAFFKL